MAVMYTQRRADWQETGAFIYRKPGVCLHAGPAAGSLLAEALGCLSRDASSSPVFHYSSPFFCLKKTNDDDRFIQTYHGGYFFSTFSHLRNNCYARRVLFSFFPGHPEWALERSHPSFHTFQDHYHQRPAVSGKSLADTPEP